MSKNLIALAFILIIIGGVGMALTSKGFFSPREVVKTEAFSAKKVKALKIYADVASIKVKTGKVDQVQVELSAAEKNVENWDTLITNHEDELLIEIKGNRKTFFALGWRQKTPKVTVTLPENTNLSDVDIHADVGKIVLEDVKATNLEARSDVSAILVERAQTEKMYVSTDVGSIRILDSTGKLDADSDVGEIRVEVSSKVTGDMDLRTSVGAIKLYVPTQPDYVNITGSSDIGSVSIFGEKAGSYNVSEAKYNITLESNIGSIDVRNKKR